MRYTSRFGWDLQAYVVLRPASVDSERRDGESIGGKRMNALEELRDWIYKNGNTYKDEVLFNIADRIEAEWMELPRDKDGKVIHVGDTVYDTLNQKRMEVFGFPGGGDILLNDEDALMGVVKPAVLHLLVRSRNRRNVRERIIRCRDCKYYLPTSVETFYCDYWTLNDLHDNNGFCARAEPKEDA